MKYKILIDLPGIVINQGFYSPERGESRWAQNLAYILGTTYRDQFEVYCWSNKKPIFGNKADCFKDWKGTLWNMHEVLDAGRKIEWDIIFDTSWHHPLMTQFYNQLNSKVYIHGHWGGCGINEPGRYPNDKHIIAFPNYKVSDSMKTCAFKHIKRHLFIPCPLIFSSNVDEAKKSNRIVWGIREGLFKRHSQDRLNRTLKLLRVVEKLSSDFEIIFMNSEELMHSSENIENVPNIINMIPKDKKRFLSSTSYDEVIEIFKTSKVLIRSGEPNSAPMEYEGISQKCFPLIWEYSNHPFQKYYDAFGLSITDDLSVENIVERVLYLVNNQKLREDIFYLANKENDVHYDYNFIKNQLLNLL